MRLSIIGVAALFVAGCATTATDVEQAETVVSSAAAQPSGEDGQEVAEADEERVICRNMQVTGSKFVRRVCGTRAEWDAQDSAIENTNQYIRKSIRAGTGQSGS